MLRGSLVFRGAGKETNTLNNQNTTTIKVWDLLVRLFHWSLVFFFFLAYIVEDDLPIVHSYAGYTVFLLVFFRIIWGFIGTPYALFLEFSTTPLNALNYVKQLAYGEARHYLGHNPAGSMMIFALFVSLSITAFFGMSLFALEGSGPFAGSFISNWSGPLLEELHEVSANITLLLIMLHVAGVIHSSWLHKENLIKAMITGNKKELLSSFSRQSENSRSNNRP